MECYNITQLLKTEGQKTRKKAVSGGSCSKGLVKHLKGGNSAFGDISGFQTSGSQYFC